MISQVIAAAKRAGRKIGICGQAPSDYPEYAEFLVKQGIDSMSLNPGCRASRRLSRFSKLQDAGTWARLPPLPLWEMRLATPDEFR